MSPKAALSVFKVKLEGDDKVLAATQPTKQPGSSPVWHEETAVLVLEKEVNEGHGLALSVVEDGTNEELLGFSVPIRHLKPFHQYNFELVKPEVPGQPSSKLYATVTVVVSSTLTFCA